MTFNSDFFTFINYYFYQFTRTGCYNIIYVEFFHKIYNIWRYIYNDKPNICDAEICKSI